MPKNYTGLLTLQQLQPHLVWCWWLLQWH